MLGIAPQAAFHVSTRGEYGMRLMVDLARHWGQGTVSLHAVAERESLPEAYLEQLVAVLRRASPLGEAAGHHRERARQPHAGRARALAVRQSAAGPRPLIVARLEIRE